MTRQQRPTRSELLARLHVGLRPKLSKSQVRDLGLVHISNLDKIARGEADELVLWHWIEAALTWSFVAGALERRNPSIYREAGMAMRLQLEVGERVARRYGRTGRVGFSGPEYLQAKEACEWMDALAEVVDRPTAVMATEWAELRCNSLMGEHGRREEKAA